MKPCFCVLQRAIALMLSVIFLSACGSSSGDSKPESRTILKNVSSGQVIEFAIDKKLKEGTFSYAIQNQPSLGEASLIGQGLARYKAGGVVGEDSIVFKISNGERSETVQYRIIINSEAEFDYQFYKLKNPNTGNSQIVRYDPNNGDSQTNQKVIKNDVILSDKVFVIRAIREKGKKVYQKREYGLFLDPSAHYETRTANTSAGTSFEYKHYLDTILKNFDAQNPESEKVVFNSAMLGADLGGQGMAAIGKDFKLHINESDIENSYVQLTAYAKLPDLIKKELPDSIKHVDVTVRLSDSAFVQGRTVALVESEITGLTNKVLVNYQAVGKQGDYPSTPSEAPRLQACQADLSLCDELGNAAKGEFYFKAQNKDYIYFNKVGSKKYYAYAKQSGDFSEVSGAQFPALFDPVRHLLGGGSSHGGNGVLSDFSSIARTHNHLAEGAKSYVLTNYNLDTKDGAYMIWGMPQKIHKNAQITLLEGTSARIIYDNGTGEDLGDESDNIAIKEHLNLVAVNNGNVFVEQGRYDKSTQKHALSSGWLKADKQAPVDKIDTVVTQQDVPYFTAHNIPTVAVGDKIYILEVPTDNGQGGKDSAKRRIYNIYALPITDTSSTKADLGNPTRGRMFLERTAVRENGVYEGSVLAWNIVNSELINVSANKVLGVAKIEDKGMKNVYGGRLGNMVGIGGMFGMYGAMGHAGDVSLISAKSDAVGSVKIVNTGAFEWIFD